MCVFCAGEYSMRIPRFDCLDFQRKNKKKGEKRGKHRKKKNVHGKPKTQ